MQQAIVYAGAALIALTVSAYIAFSFYVSYTATHPPRRPSDSTPESMGLQYEDVHILSSDGLPLKAWYVPSSSDRAVVLVSGYDSSLSTHLRIVKVLHEGGYGVLRLGLRAQGESGSALATYGLMERYDIIAGVEYLKERQDLDPECIGIFGTSMGAASAILAAADYRDIRAVVCDSPFSSAKSAIMYRLVNVTGNIGIIFEPVVMFFVRAFTGLSSSALAPENIVGRISPRATLIFRGTGDTTVNPEDGQAIYDKAGDPKEILTFEGSEHVMGFYDRPEEYCRALLSFLDRYL
jgi:uncharacterized protein